MAATIMASQHNSYKDQAHHKGDKSLQKLRKTMKSEGELIGMNRRLRTSAIIE